MKKLIVLLLCLFSMTSYASDGPHIVEKTYTIKVNNKEYELATEALVLSRELLYQLNNKILVGEEDSKVINLDIPKSINVHDKDIERFFNILSGVQDIKALTFDGLVKSLLLADFLQTTGEPTEEVNKAFYLYVSAKTKRKYEVAFKLQKEIKKIEDFLHKTITFTPKRNILGEIIDEIRSSIEKESYDDYFDGEGFLWDLQKSISADLLKEVFHFEEQTMSIPDIRIRGIINYDPNTVLVHDTEKIVLINPVDSQIKEFLIKGKRSIDCIAVLHNKKALLKFRNRNEIYSRKRIPQAFKPGDEFFPYRALE